MSTTRGRDRASLGAALRLSGTAAATTWAGASSARCRHGASSSCWPAPAWT